MGGFSPKGHARVDPAKPQAFGICDCCGFLYLRAELYGQVAWMGNQLRQTGFLHCSTCLDVPNPTVRPIKLPADPPPVFNPRPDKPQPTTSRPDYVPPKIP